MADARDLDATGRLLGVGCRPGTLTLLLAPWFEAVVGRPARVDGIPVSPTGS